MAFLSAPFFCFFPVTVLGYALLPRGLKAGWLLVMSWVFYLAAGPQYAPFLLCAILLSYGAGLLAGKGKRWAAPGTVILCVGILFIFKYLNFACSLAAGALNALGFSLSSPALDLLLPAGLSFYLFAAMGYVLDVARGKLPPERNFLRYALFLSFFPHLLSGPIPRAPQLLPQLKELPPVTWDGLREGLFRFLWGAFKKLVLADRLAILVNLVFGAPGEFGRLQVLLAAFAFSLQIYCDFSAYSDMALGAAKAMGFTLMENFRAPYFARSIQEFWRRWHISLSSWFRDYLYIPLGGNRVGKGRLMFNLLIVWAATGIWHGASWNFLIWGLYYFCFIMLEKLWLGKYLKKAPAAISHLYGIFVVVVGWAIFAVEDFNAMELYLKAMFGMGAGLVDSSALYYLFNYLPMLVVACVAATPLAAKVWHKIPAKVWKPALPVLVCLALVLATAYLVDGTYNPFLYFRF